MSFYDKPKPGKGSGDPCTLFAGGLPWDVQEASLQEYFAQFGTVLSVDLKLNPDTGRSRGFAFVTYDCPESAEAVLTKGRHEIEGQKIDVKGSAHGVGKWSDKPKPIRHGFGKDKTYSSLPNGTTTTSTSNSTSDAWDPSSSWNNWNQSWGSGDQQPDQQQVMQMMMMMQMMQQQQGWSNGDGANANNNSNGNASKWGSGSDWGNQNNMQQMMQMYSVMNGQTDSSANAISSSSGPSNSKGKGNRYTPY